MGVFDWGHCFQNVATVRLPMWGFWTSIIRCGTLFLFFSRSCVKRMFSPVFLLSVSMYILQDGTPIDIAISRKTSASDLFHRPGRNAKAINCYTMIIWVKTIPDMVIIKVCNSPFVRLPDRPVKTMTSAHPSNHSIAVSMATRVSWVPRPTITSLCKAKHMWTCFSYISHKTYCFHNRL